MCPSPVVTRGRICPEPFFSPRHPCSKKPPLPLLKSQLPGFLGAALSPETQPQRGMDERGVQGHQQQAPLKGEQAEMGLEAGCQGAGLRSGEPDGGWGVVRRSQTQG